MNIEELWKIEAPSAHEEKLAGWIKKFALQKGKKSFRDVMGSVFISCGGKKKETLMVVVHLDEPGLLITSYEGDGRAHIAALGQLQTSALLGARVKVGEREGLVLAPSGKEPADCKVTDFTVDFGFEHEEEGKRLLPPGTALALDRNFMTLNDKDQVGRFAGKKAMIALALEEAVKEEEFALDTTFVFTAQKELGNRGAKVAVERLQADYTLVLSLDETAKKGKGAVIKLADKGVLCDKEITELLRKAAEKEKIEVQYSVDAPRGGEESVCQLAGKGSFTGSLALPICDMGLSHERFSLKDYEKAKKLLSSFLAGAGQ